MWKVHNAVTAQGVSRGQWPTRVMFPPKYVVRGRVRARACACVRVVFPLKYVVCGCVRVRARHVPPQVRCAWLCMCVRACVCACVRVMFPPSTHARTRAGGFGGGEAQQADVLLTRLQLALRACAPSMRTIHPAATLRRWGGVLPNMADSLPCRRRALVVNGGHGRSRLCKLRTS